MQQDRRHLRGLPALPREERERPRSRLLRRPGERREPVPFEQIPHGFAAAAANAGLSIACAVEIAVEFELVRRDLADLGQELTLEPLVADAMNARIRTPVAAPLACYLRMLFASRPRPLNRLELEEPIDVAFRLFPRVLSVDAQEVLTPERLHQALALERAAASAGRTMSEYALRFAAAR